MTSRESAPVGSGPRGMPASSVFRFIRTHKQLILHLLIVGVVISMLAVYKTVPAVRVVLMPELSPLVLGPRVLVISPHPDDETLGAGGLMHQAASSGSEVRVVFMTNGDGFRRGVQAERNSEDTPVTALCYVDYGRKRQLEAIAALKCYGLGADSAVFLGYPDGGLSHLWWNNWSPSRPYGSSTTLARTVPYSLAYETGAVYAGESVIRNLRGILQEFDPSVVIVPHPHDSHADHWASHAFVVAALALQQREGHNSEVDIYNYLIHRGTWQKLPIVSKSNPMAPPNDIVRCADTEWYRFHVNLQSLKAKELAIRSHKSQYVMMGDFLNNFLRNNEIFGSLARKELTMTGNLSYLDGRWTHEPLINDPKGDGRGSNVSLAGDLKSLSLVQGVESLYLRLEAWAALSAPSSYRVGVYYFPEDSEERLERWIFRVTPGRFPPFMWEENPAGDYTLPPLSLRGDTLTVALPLEAWSRGGKLLVGAESRIGPYLVDTIPWWCIEVK